MGLQMSSVLAEAGVNLVLAARKLERCEAVGKEFEEKYGIKTLAVTCDITKPEDCQNLADVAMKEFGRIDILINNSGVTWGDDFFKHSLKGWQKVIDTNLTGNFILTQAVARYMKDKGGMKILNVSSTGGIRAPRRQQTPAYNASKAALIHLTADLSLQLAQYNIHVNAIAPGYFPSGMTDIAGFMEKTMEAAKAINPFGRIGNDDDLKGAVLFFCSKASDYVTGQTLVIDGGSSL